MNIALKDWTVALILWLLILVTPIPKDRMIPNAIVIVLALIAWAFYVVILSREQIKKRKKSLLWIMQYDKDGLKKWTGIARDGSILRDRSYNG